MKKKDRRYQVKDSDRKRLVSVSLFLSLLFCALVMQFYRLQILEGEKWAKEANNQHRHVEKEYFMRGTFYSNTSIKKNHPQSLQAFVIEIPKFHLHVDCDCIPNGYKKEIATKIFEFVTVKNEDKNKIFAEFFKKSRSRKIVGWLDRDTKDNIEKWWLSYAKSKKIARNSLFFIQDYKRSYPFGSLLGQVLHTVQDEKDPISFQSIPTGGLELYLNNYLKGKLGKREILRSPRHPLDVGTLIQKPQNGSDIYLTINHYLQAIAEEELAKGVKAVNGKGGWAIMIDPYSGEVLALAQTPAFDLRRYNEYFNNKGLQEHTRTHAVIDAFEPGSIFKPLVVALCLKANEELIQMGKKPLFSPTERIDTSNGHFPGRSFPLKDARLHRSLNMYMGIQKSSNVYMGKIMHRLVTTMKEEWIKKTFAELFGLSKKTNIELPAETPGVLPTPGKLHPNGKLEWSLSTPYSLAIGHNVLVTSMQIARAYSIIANGGFEVQPTLIKKIVKKVDGQEVVLLDNTPKFQMQNRKRLLSDESTKELKKALKFTTKPGGTAPSANVWGYSEAGKTGTSEKIINGQYSHELYISSFVGFVPADKPRFVLIVTVDEPQKRYDPTKGKTYMGGVCAAPIFKEIATRALEYLGVAPDDPFGYARTDPRYKEDQADWSKELKALKELYSKWNE
ncbi:MAG: penicillin-binding protein 2 [Chlamydiae bacterium]|nr:penicillin-binding protein 2 [Chlamydiota bacterium]